MTTPPPYAGRDSWLAVCLSLAATGHPAVSGPFHLLRASSISVAPPIESPVPFCHSSFHHHLTFPFPPLSLPTASSPIRHVSATPSRIILHAFAVVVPAVLQFCYFESHLRRPRRTATATALRISPVIPDP